VSLNLDKSTWKRVAFGDVVRNVNLTVRDSEVAGIDRVIAMEHLDPGELKIERWGSLADGTTFTRRVKPGQTLFGKRRAYQRKVAYAEFDAICSGDILTFESDESQMLSEFLPFLVQSNEFSTTLLAPLPAPCHRAPTGLTCRTSSSTYRPSTSRSASPTSSGPSSATGVRYAVALKGSPR